MTVYSKQVYQNIAAAVERDQSADALLYCIARTSSADNQRVMMLQNRAAFNSMITRERLFDLIDNVSLNQE